MMISQIENQLLSFASLVVALTSLTMLLTRRKDKDNVVDLIGILVDLINDPSPSSSWNTLSWRRHPCADLDADLAIRHTS